MSTKKSIPGRFTGDWDTRAFSPVVTTGQPCALFDGLTVDTIADVATDWEGGDDRLGSVASIGNPPGDGIDVFRGTNFRTTDARHSHFLTSSPGNHHAICILASHPELQVSDVPAYSYRHRNDICAYSRQYLISTPLRCDGAGGDDGAAVVVPGGSTTTVGTGLFAEQRHPHGRPCTADRRFRC